jgi:hypothetical protein
MMPHKKLNLDHLLPLCIFRKTTQSKENGRGMDEETHLPFFSFFFGKEKRLKKARNNEV